MGPDKDNPYLNKLSSATVFNPVECASVAIMESNTNNDLTTQASGGITF